MIQRHLTAAGTWKQGYAIVMTEDFEEQYFWQLERNIYWAALKGPKNTGCAFTLEAGLRRQIGEEI